MTPQLTHICIIKGTENSQSEIKELLDGCVLLFQQQSNTITLKVLTSNGSEKLRLCMQCLCVNCKVEWKCRKVWMCVCGSQGCTLFYLSLTHLRTLVHSPTHTQTRPTHSIEITISVAQRIQRSAILTALTKWMFLKMNWMLLFDPRLESKTNSDFQTHQLLNSLDSFD